MPTNEKLIQLLIQNSKILNLEEGFYDYMLSMRDWEFIIILSTMFEAALVEGVVRELNNDKIKGVLSYLDLANTKCGKIEFAKNLSIITNDDAKFIRKIAEIRNLLAHRIDQRNFKISVYIENECKDNAKKLNSMAKTLSNRLNDQIQLSDGKKLNKPDAILKEPKEMLLANSMDILTNIVYLTEKS